VQDYGLVDWVIAPVGFGARLIPNEDCLSAVIIELLQIWPHVPDMRDTTECAKVMHGWGLTMPGHVQCLPVKGAH
jgi:hypothetical protein